MSYALLMERIGALNDVLNAQSVLYWDARTMMPENGHETRTKQMGTLSVVARDMLVSSETRRLLDSAEAELFGHDASSVELTMVSQVREALDYHQAIPSELTRRRAELGSLGNLVWAKARAESDFSQFAPLLKQVVALNREIAESVGYSAHPYDALLHIFDAEDTVASLNPLFSRLRDGILPLLRKVSEADQPRSDFLEREYPVDKQFELTRILADRLGYDFKRGRIDTTLHPFEISFTRNDVRITTRFNQNHLATSLFGTMHEVGHALYEQGLDPAYTRTPFATDMVGLYAVGGVSYGAHESQSRLWENHVGRSLPFWEVHFPTAQEIFPEQLGDVTAEEFWRAVNRVRPGPLRTQADELTYDLHIMMRTDIEIALMEGTVGVDELPEIWNAKIKDYLGVDVPNDTLGVLQDFHWSAALLGNFGNYTTGNVMAAQLMDVAKRDPIIERGISAGEYTPLHGYLSANVYKHGRRFERDDLLVRATGRKLDPEPYLAYLNSKFSALYSL